MGFLVVIDGSSGSGKGTLAQGLAQLFGAEHLDTGRYYRAVALKVMLTGIENGDWEKIIQIAEGLTEEDLKPSELRSPEVTARTPLIALDLRVREAVNRHIWRLIDRGHNLIIDGRNGAREFPHAHAKIFLTASAEAQARRRHEQYQGEGRSTSYEEVLEGIRERDRLDREREVAPLCPVEEAHQIESSELSIDEVLYSAVAYCAKKLPAV